MARRGLLYALARAGAQAQREREKQQRAQARAYNQATRAAAQAERAYERSLSQYQRQAAKEQREYDKEQARLYLESRLADVALDNADLDDEILQLNTLLKDTLSVDDYFDLDNLKQAPQIPHFEPGYLAVQEPAPIHAAYLPADIGMKKFLPGAKDKYAQEVAAANQRYQADLFAHSEREAARVAALLEHRANYERHIQEKKEAAARQHAEVDEFKKELAFASPDAIVSYFTIVLDRSLYPENFPHHAKLAYVPESKQLVLEHDLPPFHVVPEVASYKYVKSKDEVASTLRPVTQRKALYASLVAQITLRTLHEIFEADRFAHIETIVYNGYVDDINKATGLPSRTCVVTVRTTRDLFLRLDLARVDPIACLNALNASLSKNPAELAPVRPVLEFNMVDPRFIEETDVISGLDQRPNLMALTPGEFEGLISNLFHKMGLETRLTQASRDGGVDCVAYDPRPIFGGKVVIQAKRYKHTVGVSAVRDLYGTMQNEGASKGILVTTSGYGKAAFDFAEGKPLELLSGSNLLYLLKEHANIEAKIEMPENWKDPEADRAEGA